MDDNPILRESNKIISKLQLLSAFFEDEIVYKIFLRTQVIHRLYETNPELDVNSLELFHLQFTQSVIDLLKKIKKINERNVGLFFDEIQLNTELINNIKNSDYKESEFNNDKQRQALKINTSLRRLYQVLSEDLQEYPFAKNINAFSARYAEDFFFQISANLLAELTDYVQEEVYTNAYAVIERKLMGKLCKHDFRTEFYCGLSSANLVVEVYKFIDHGMYFLFYPSRNLFLFCDISKLSDIDLTTDITRNARIIQELQDKNDRLQASAAITRISIPAEVKSLLAENYKKISNINFLQNIAGFDAQANILKTMLNTDII
ncbi:hypothetical protein EOD41_14260 [Mucilaginibacter limnophilus]|uniref:Uncharacterized protein n=1 Tax=Mucilaginibacter limnophilus TaxID=1932778 RepID=A0A3S2V754_9SPHI|nr:hypothetical protein [Mucilaginibacter limnophilus]RVU00119.1 hypothetical protein EOD41_14260 [Mucilaginibacter limnophilus]